MINNIFKKNLKYNIIFSTILKKNGNVILYIYIRERKNNQNKKSAKTLEKNK